MPALSSEQTARARKNFAVILRSIATAGQEPVGAAIAKDGSTISKMQGDGRIEDFATILAACGLKVVPVELRCYDPKTIDTLLHGHRQWLGSIESHEQLTWE